MLDNMPARTRTCSTYWYDLSANSEGLFEGVREFLDGGGDGLAMNLVGPAGVVTKAVDQQVALNCHGGLERLPYIPLRGGEKKFSEFRPVLVVWD